MRQAAPYEVELEHLLERKVAFLAAFFVVFFCTYGLLYAIDFVPETPPEEPAPRAETTAAAVAQPDEVVEPLPEDPYPVRVTIDALDRGVQVLNPTERDVASLDAALLEGVVRHPDSAMLGEEGTVLLFGHSSYLPTVYNKNFQAFNGLQNLAWGDIIRVRSTDAEYVYRVERVYKVTASAAEVRIASTEPRLALVTCNSFGSKDDRFVVEAKLVETTLL